MRKIILALTITLLIFTLSQNVLAIGLVSEPLVIDNALRGEIFEDELSAFNSEDKDALFELSAQGDIANWVSFYLADDLENSITQIAAPAKSYAKTVVNITVPEDTPNGEYSGKLTVTLRPITNDDKDKESSATVSQRLSRKATINVTDNEIAKLLVSVIPHTFDIKNNQPLNIRFIYDNQGNVRLSPQIDFKILKIEGNDKGIVYNVIFPYPEDELPIKPGEIREISSISVPTTELKDGKYIAEMKFLHNNKEILTKDFKFNISTQGKILGVLDIDSKIFWPIVIVVFVFLIIIGRVFLQKRKQS